MSVIWIAFTAILEVLAIFKTSFAGFGVAAKLPLKKPSVDNGRSTETESIPIMSEFAPTGPPCGT